MRIRLNVSYDGTAFLGFQDQPGGQTVQTVLEKALATVLGETGRVVPSGRTDKGVHAFEQPCQLDLKTPKAIERATKNDFLIKLNALLPGTISVRKMIAVKPDWHARKSAKRKTYVYVILIARQRNPLLENLAWRVFQPLSLAPMRKAAKLLVGTHDYSAFCASDSTVKDKTRTLHKLILSTKNPFGLLAHPDDKFIVLTVTGSGFLKHMVRNIAGTLAAIGLGKMTPAQIKTILAGRDRSQAGLNAPPQGLFLQKVVY